MTRTIKVLHLDDDIWAQRMIQTLLEQEVEGLEVTARSEPNCRGEFDVYFLDNDFGGDRCAGRLARTIREQHPDALIIAFSATLDSMVLKELINTGCDGVCDKSVPDDTPFALSVVREYAEALRQAGSTPPRTRGIFGRLRGLLHDWNARLEKNEEHLKV